MPTRKSDVTDSQVLSELRDAGYRVDIDTAPRDGDIVLTLTASAATRSGAVATDITGIDTALMRAARRVELKAAGKRLAATLHDLPVLPRAARVAALTQVEQRWRDIESEYGLLNSQQIKALTGSRAENASSAASKLRAAGKALSVNRNRTLLFPAFQFAGDGTVHAVIPKLLSLMGGSAGWTNESITLWLTAPNGYLPGGGRPADHLTDEAAVLRAAHAATSPT